MIQNCLICEKKLIVNKIIKYTNNPSVVEIDIITICSLCRQVEYLKKEKKETSKKVRELNKRLKSLENIQTKILKETLENEYLTFLKSQE